MDDDWGYPHDSGNHHLRHPGNEDAYGTSTIDQFPEKLGGSLMMFDGQSKHMGKDGFPIVNVSSC